MFSEYHIKNGFWVDRKKIKIGFLYLFMVGGGALHLSGLIDQFLSSMAAFVMLSITTWLMFEFVNYWRQNYRFKHHFKDIYLQFYAWLFFIFIISVVIENIGVKSGSIFGKYEYGNVLKPVVLYVPIAIGFAWINILLPSIVIADQILRMWGKQNPFLIAIATAILMVFFDYIMEPSAIKLGYWSWEAGKIPLQNYAVWFIMGCIFALIAIKLRLLRFGTPVLLVHAFVSQLFYFGLIALK
jgi:putative membrane protein